MGKSLILSPSAFQVLSRLVSSVVKDFTLSSTANNSHVVGGDYTSAKLLFTCCFFVGCSDGKQLRDIIANAKVWQSLVFFEELFWGKFKNTFLHSFVFLLDTAAIEIGSDVPLSELEPYSEDQRLYLVHLLQHTLTTMLHVKCFYLKSS